MIKLLTKRRLHLILIVVSVIIAYSNIFQNQFVIDDYVFIKDWDIPKSFFNIPAIFAGETAPVGHELVYRPVRAVFYTIAYQLSGLNPLGYHLQSVLIHLVNTILVYLIVGKLLKSAKFVPFAAALFFGLHPLQTEAITYITASFDVIGVVFFLSSFYFYLNKKRYLSYFLATLAFFTYEMTLTLPVLLMLYDLTLGRSKRMFNLKKYVPYLILAAVFIFIRVVVLGITARGEYLNNSFYITQLTMVKAWTKYIFLSFVPLNLSINQAVASGIRSWVHPLAAMDRIYSQTIFDIDILIRIILLGGVIFAAIKSHKKHPIVSFAIGWFFITLLPVAYFIPQGPIMQERYLYIPLFGFVLLLSYMLTKLKNHNLQLKLLTVHLVILTSVALMYGLRTYSRNFDWKDSLAVWSALAKNDPESVIANYYTALEYEKRDNYDQAIEYVNKALAIQPRLHEAYYLLGKIYEQLGQKELVKQNYEKALEIYPGFAPAQEKLEELVTGKKTAKEAEWSEYLTKYGFSFSYPTAWKLTKIDKGAKLTDETGLFNVELKLIKKDFAGNMQQFLALPGLSLQSYGVLISQGLAQVPDVVEAYVRIWDNNNIQLMQFFLLKDKKVVQVVVWPADSVKMKEFSRILGTVKMDIRQTVN